jgi:DNA-binding NarL/FixJ family response regulator
MTTEVINVSERKNVLICDTQPVAVEGMKWLIENTGDMQFAGSVPTLEAVYNLLYPPPPEVKTPEAEASEGMEPVAGMEAPVAMEAAEVPAETAAEAAPETVAEPLIEAELPEPIRLDAIVIDKGLGFNGVMDLLQRLTANSHPTPVVVWGAAVSEAEALRLLQAGARGILRRTSESGTLLTCLRAVTSGGTWMEDGIFGSAEKLFNPKRSQLTNRESQVVVLVEKGLRNRDIARQLGIQTGTVKIHLKHIFEKTGVRGRYGLAFTGLQNKGSIATAPQQFTA